MFRNEQLRPECRGSSYHFGEQEPVWRPHHLIQGDEPMNADQSKGKWMQFKGELKKQYGKFTDDDLKQIEGNHDKFVGKVQERYGDKKDELMKWADQWHQQLQPDATKGKTH